MTLQIIFFSLPHLVNKELNPMTRKRLELFFLERNDWPDCR